MKKIIKKSMSIVLTIIMVISLLGTGVVYAQDATDDLIIAKDDAVMEITADRTSTLTITNNTTIIMKANASILVNSGNAIKVSAGKTLTIVLNGYTLDVKTTATRMAGIFLPRTSTLIVREGNAKNGTFNVQGGPGTAPSQGTTGTTPTYDNGRGGIGGEGGRGGTAPGAGIGSNGSSGGYGSSDYGVPIHVAVNPNDQGKGGPGGAGSDSSVSSDNNQCGNVFMFGDINVTVKAGDHKGATGGRPAAAGYLQYPGYASAGGGAGGNGGSAYGAAGIGAGGIGGAGGGAGGAGGVMRRTEGSTADIYIAGGGGGGAGQTGGLGGYASFSSYANGTDGGRHAAVAGGNPNNGNGGVGGNGGTVPPLPDQTNLGYLYSSSNTTTVNTSANSTTNSASNKKLTNKIYLLSECIIEIDDSNIVYDGNTKRPDIILKDKDGNKIDSEINKNYTLTYSNNIDAGEKTGTITIKSNGSITDQNHLLVDGGSYDIKFTIKPNEEPLSIAKADAISSYIYGSSFQASVNKHTANKGIISWDTVVDDNYKAEIASVSIVSPEIIPTKVGKMKLRVTITQDKKNANGVYNFPEVMTAELSDDILVKPKNIDETDIAVPSIGPYTYAGGQIKPTYAKDAYKSGQMQFSTNKDKAHTFLEEGVDFRLEYGENTNVADGGTVKIIGIGNYEGEKNPIAFTINARDINDPTVHVSATNPAYTGNSMQVSPMLKIIDTNMNTEYQLPSSTYELSWASKKNDGTFKGVDFVNIGTKQITMVGTGNLNGTRTQNYEILKADVGTINLGIDRAKDVYFDGKEIESRPTLKYYDYLLTENGTTSSSQNVDVPNPDDYEISFSDHKEAGKTKTTITGINNFTGTKILDGSENGGYDVLKRPLYILPEANQWKYFGAKDIFGIDQNKDNPTYHVFIRSLNDSATEEKKDADLSKDEVNRQFITNNIPILNYPIELVGSLSREGADNQLLDARDTTYKYTTNDLKLTDATKDSYEVKLVDNESSYKIKSYLYDGEPANIIGTLGKNDWYIQKPVEFNAPIDYTISKSDELDSSKNSWNSKTSYDDGDYSKNGVTYFLKYFNPDNMNDPANGAISSGITHKYKQDTVLPTGSLTITSDAWTAFNAHADFNYFLNSDATGFILAKDDMSQMNVKHYYISDKKLGKDELDEIKVPQKDAGSYNPIEDSQKEIWIEENQFQLNIDELNTKRKYVYVRLEDYAGNVSYLNSDGIVFDKDAPILKAEYKEDALWTISNDVKITGVVSDENAGLKDRYVAYQMDEGALQVIEGYENGTFEIKNLKDGNYTLTISAWDKANNQAAPISFHVMKDTQTPRILLQANTTTIATQQAITFDPRVGASGVAQLELSYNGGDWQVIKTGVQAPYIAKENGVYTFRITNGAGVVSKESSIEFTKIDTKTPNIEVRINDLIGQKIEDNGFTNSDLQVMFANIEKNLGDSKFEYSLDNGINWSEVNENLDNEAQTKLSLTEGNYTIQFRITAQNGLRSEKEFYVGIDRTIPKISISVQDVERNLFERFIDLFRNKRQVVKAITSDEGLVASGVAQVQSYTVEGKATQSSLPTDPKAIEKMVKDNWVSGSECEVEKGSSYIVYFKVTDKAGNITYARSDRIVIDDAAPDIEATYELEGKWDKDPQIDVYVFDASPGVDKVEYRVDDGTPITGSEQFTIENLGLSTGEHMIDIYATDMSGNTAKKSIKVKVDTGIPTISAIALTPSKIDVPIKVEANYTGSSGLDKILLSKNGQDFEDITDVIKREGQYLAKENGEYIFRAVTGAGVYAETKVDIDEFTAIESDIKAVVSAKLEDGTQYTSGSWTNQNVKVSFSNHIANLKGLSYQVSVNGGAWQPVNVVNGYLETLITTEGQHQYDFKVIFDATQVESNIASINVNIDKTLPVSTMKIENISWNGNDFIENGFTYDSYFKDQKYALIEATDSLSGVEHKEIFVMKEADIPSSVKGQTTASKIETLGENRWMQGGSITINPNDKYVVFGKVYDHSGNVSYVSSNGTVFDDINPTLESDINQEDWYKDDITDIHFNVDDNLSEVKKVNYKINEGSLETASLSYGEFVISTGKLRNGQNNIAISVIDNAENETIANYLVKKDTVQPTIQVVDNIGNGKLVTKNVLEVNPTVGLSGIDKIEVKKPDAGGWDDITDSYKSGYIAQEKGTYWFRIVNGAGNSAITSITLNNISKDIPIINYIMTTDDGKDYFEGNWSQKNIQVQFTNENGNQTVEKYLYKVDNGSYQELTPQKDGSATFKSIEGSHIYTMKLVLDNGLESEEVSVNMKIDAIAPKIQVNSDLSQWVKETQELEVEVIDNESGINSQGYSFDNGYTWQSENKMKIRANKIVGLKAKDAVENISSEKAIVGKIDSQGPTVEELKQIGAEKSKIRDLKAKVEDYCDLTNRRGSGIAEVYAMTTYPYKDGEFNPNPDRTFDMVEKNGTWVTKESLTVPYNGTNSVWLVTEDYVGNQKIYSIEVTNMIGSGDEDGKIDKPTPEEPTYPDDPSQPNKPSNPNNPDNPSNSQKPGNSGNSQGSQNNNQDSKNPNGSQNQTGSSHSSQEITIISKGGKINNTNNETLNANKKYADGFKKVEEDTEKINGIQKSLTQGSYQTATVKVVYLIPWILLVIILIWISYLFYRYRRLKHNLENNVQDESEVD